VPLRLAFYLPQFHPTPEKRCLVWTGIHRWTVVARSRPLFPGHVQPHLPGELGFCDIRLPETRELQARLARAHGISGFCYYHYWFKGRRMLERPFHIALSLGKPDSSLLPLLGQRELVPPLNGCS
jgi:lipopolysaccharide biosynthesis protein